MAVSLREELEHWNVWAREANKTENGWQSDYPAWDRLLAAAKLAMVAPNLTPEDTSRLDQCWEISEETEDLAGFARENLDACLPRLAMLANSSRRDTRWQVYDVLGDSGARGEVQLRKGLSDPDAYCRRRAAIALSRLKPPDSHNIAERLLADPDPAVRRVAKEFRQDTAKPNTVD